MQLFTIFGNPVSHSKSPLMHNLAFKGLNYNGCYTRYKLEDGTQLRKKMLDLNIKGANITVPHKEDAFRACDELDIFAKLVKSVNTIINKDGKLYGYNTDAPGFLQSISMLKELREILILGAGGTAKSTAVVLKEAGYNVTILNRSEGRLEQFKNDGFTTYSFDTFKNIKNYDLIVNMTSAGLEEDTLPAPLDILKHTLPNSQMAIDIIYGKETPFLKLAKSYGIPTADGSSMLLNQGVLAFEYFTDKKFKFEEIKVEMQKAFLL